MHGVFRPLFQRSSSYPVHAHPRTPHRVPVWCHRPLEAGCPAEAGETREGRVLRERLLDFQAAEARPSPTPRPIPVGTGPLPNPLRSGVGRAMFRDEVASPLFSPQGVKAGGVWATPALLGADAQGRTEEEMLHGEERGPPPLCRAGPSGTGAAIPSPRPSELARPREHGLEAKSPFEGGGHRGLHPLPDGAEEHAKLRRMWKAFIFAVSGTPPVGLWLPLSYRPQSSQRPAVSASGVSG